MVGRHNDEHAYVTVDEAEQAAMFHREQQKRMLIEARLKMEARLKQANAGQANANAVPQRGYNAVFAQY